MAAAHNHRSKPPLHNFSLPPSLKWGHQKFLRCMKLSPEGDEIDETHISQSQSQSSPTQNRKRDRNQDRGRDRDQTHSQSSIQLTNYRSPPTSGKSPIRRRFGDFDPESENGLEVGEVREKLTLDLQAAAKKLKVSILDQSLEPARPWNLRTRRAACKAPTPTQEQQLGPSPKRVVDDDSEVVVAPPLPEDNGRRAEFTVALSREEVEEDFRAMLGKRPPRRPKKRARVIQRQLECIFPGSWLSEVTPELYKVPDVPESG